MNKLLTRGPGSRITTPKSFNKDSPPYTCPELDRNPGIPDSRFQAFSLPSRIGNRLVYPKNV